MIDADHILACPTCLSTSQVIPLVSCWWCDRCRRAFSKLESEQAKEIVDLKATIQKLKPSIRRSA